MKNTLILISQETEHACLGLFSVVLKAFRERCALLIKHSSSKTKLAGTGRFQKKHKCEFILHLKSHVLCN